MHIMSLLKLQAPTLNLVKSLTLRIRVVNFPSLEEHYKSMAVDPVQLFHLLRVMRMIRTNRGKRFLKILLMILMPLQQKVIVSAVLM